MSKFYSSILLALIATTLIGQCPTRTPLSLPYVESFEDASGFVKVNSTNAHCDTAGIWAFETTAPNSGRLSFNLGYSSSGLKGASLDRDGGVQLCTNFLIGTLDLSNYDTAASSFVVLDFQHMDHGDELHPNDKVWIRGNPAESWVEIYDLDANGSDGHFVHADNINITNILRTADQNFSSQFQVRFGQEGRYRLSTGASFDGRTFDEIRLVEEICPAVGNFSFQAAGTDGGFLQFDGPGSYQVEYGPCGFVQGNGTTASGSAPLSLSALSAETCYEVYVQRQCGSSGSSTWSGPFSFTTPCLPKVAPYFEDFEGSDWIASSNFDGTGDLMDVCWSRAPAPSAYSWVVRNGPTPTTGTGPVGDHTTGTGNYLAVETDNPPYFIDAELYSPVVDLSALSVPQVSFYYHMYGDVKIDTIFVDVLSDGVWHNRQLALGDQMPASASPYQKATLHLSAFSDTVQLRFRIFNALGGNKRDVAIDDVSFEEGMSCPKPLSITTSNLTDTSALLSWSSPAANSWILIYDTAGFDPASGGMVDTASSVPYLLDGLSPGIPYDIYVIGDCGLSGTSDTSDVFNFRTNCPTGLNAPYFNSFEQDDAYAPPVCWTLESSLGVGFFQVLSNTIHPAASGSKMVYLSTRNWHSRNDTIMLIAPPLNGLAANDKRIRFKARGMANTNIVVVSLASPHSDSGFVPLDTLTLSTTFVYEEFTAYLNSTNGHNLQDSYVGLKVESNPNTSLQIDDFWYEAAPICSDVTNVVLESHSDTSATFGFSAQYDSVEYEWGTKGFSPGTGITGSAVGQDLSIGNLAPGGSYQLYIRSLCPMGTSNWVGPFYFRSLCGDQAPITLPYFEDFEGLPTDTFNLPGGIKCDSVSALDLRKPLGYGEGRALIDSDPTHVHSGTHALSIDAGSSAGTPLSYLSLRLDMSNYSAPHSFPIELSFYHMSEGHLSNDSDRVYIRGADTATWIEVFNIATQSMGLAGEFRKVDNIFVDSILALNGQSFTESFEIRFGEKSRSQVYIPGDIEGRTFDDILLREVRCEGAEGVEAYFVDHQSAGIKWSSQAEAFEVEFGPKGYVAGTGTSVFVTDTFAVINGLTAGTSYDFYVKDSCSTGHFSGYEGPAGVLTNCMLPSPLTLPFHEGFENLSGNFATQALFCDSVHHWKYQGDHWTSRLRLHSNTDYVNTGNSAATLDLSSYYSVFAPTNHLTLFVNLQNYTTAPRINLSFSYMSDSQSDRNNNRVWVRSADTAAWVEIYDLDANRGSRWLYHDVQDLDIVLPLLNSGQSITSNIQIRFGQQGTAPSNIALNSDGYSFDDIRLEALECAYPVQLNVSALSDTAATLVWTSPPGAVGNSEVWIGPQGFYQGPNATIGGTRAFAATDELTLDSLLPNHCYEFLVRTACAANDTSDWTGPYRFCTPCTPYTAPYSENFDNVPPPALPDCWGEIDNGDDDLFSVISTDHGAVVPSFPNAIEFNDGNLSALTPDTAMLISPPFSDLGTGLNQIRFKVANEAGPSGGELIIGTMAHPKDPSSFVPYDTLKAADLRTNFTEYTFILDQLPRIGSNNHIAFLHGSSSFEIYLDDFFYEAIPDCRPPLSLAIPIIDAHSATLQWSSANSGSGMGYEVEYGPALLSPGSGTRAFTATPDVTISALAATIDYCFYVREICAVGDTSAWSSPQCFTTACGDLVAPHVENFENLSIGNGPIFDNCWESSTGGPYWTVQQSDGTDLNTKLTGPIYDHTLGIAGPGKYIFMESNIANDSAELTTPWIDISALSQPELSYWYYMYGAGIGALSVAADTGTGYFALRTISGQQQTQNGEPWHGDTLRMAPADSVRIKFTGIVGSTSPWVGDIAIDDVSIYNSENCPAPAPISATSLGCDSILLDFGTGTGFFIEYGPAGFNLGSGSHSPIITGSSFAIGNFQPGTAYDFYVADTCMGDTSNFIGPATVTTDSAPLPNPQIVQVRDTSYSAQKHFLLYALDSVEATYQWFFGNGLAGNGDTIWAKYYSSGNYMITLVASNSCGDDTTLLPLNVTIGLNESKPIRAEIFPNPADDVLYVMIPEDQISWRLSIVDMTGREVLRRHLDKKNHKKKFAIDTQKLAPGTYLVKLESSDGNIHTKIIVH